ncbi:hypothetical protein QYG89_11170 [Bacillus sp. B190/17]|uniref:Uncharacterized protein n=1 Tax=Bacillus lumedeiriae TaxID=3058829 RepID=A0ABW8IB55_9BACI
MIRVIIRKPLSATGVQSACGQGLFWFIQAIDLYGNEVKKESNIE